METVELTSDERAELTQMLKNSRKEFIRLIIAFIVAFLLTMLIFSWQASFSFQLIISLSAVFGLMFLPILIIRVLSNSNRKLQSDLQIGKKVSGQSTIIKINFLNRTVTLIDGTIVDEGLEVGLWKKGDLISYSKTVSGEHIFSSKRL